MRAFLGLFLLTLATPAFAEPMNAADKAKLEGVWRQNANTASDACGTDGHFQYGVEITIEFKLTGGEIDVEDQAEGSGPDTITSATKKAGTYYLALADRNPPWDIKLTGKDKATFYGQSFTRCAAAEARDGIKLGKDDFAYLSTGFVTAGEDPNYGVYFVNSRNPAGCKASAFQALAFNLRSPIDPSLLRFQSYALKQRLDARKKPGFPIDTGGMGRWPIEAIAKTATGWTLKMIELIPPNGSRGDAMTVDVVRTKTGISIPAWKRDYTRCTFSG